MIPSAAILLAAPSRAHTHHFSLYVLFVLLGFCVSRPHTHSIATVTSWPAVPALCTRSDSLSVLIPFLFIFPFCLFLLWCIVLFGHSTCSGASYPSLQLRIAWPPLRSQTSHFYGC
jgi:hypothetical protein